MALPTVDELARAATDATGLDGFGEDSWREGLAVLVASLDEEAQLNDLGRAVVEGELVGYLSTRLRVLEHRRTHPQIADGTIVEPIVIVGQGRTGTTILYDLLAQDANHRVPLTWEVDFPVPPPRTATYDTDPRIAQVDETLAGLDLVLPGFRAMHPMGAQLAQECVRITALDFKSMIFPTQYRVPSYTNWLLHEADMSSAYRWHRLYLQHLQSEHPATRWALKSPGHIWCLDALVAEYPDALLVQTHRDPLRILASIGSLVAKLRTLSSDTSTIPVAAAEFAESIILGLDRSVDRRLDGTVAADRVVDLQFRDFMVEPFATIRAIYQRLGLALSDENEQAMRAFLADNPQGKHGVHQYTFAATELDVDEMKSRCARYNEYFGVATEPLA
jgi:Sulfotransferase family